MRTTLASCSILLALTPTAIGQAVTSPKGLDNTAGNATFFASTNRRFQGIDATHLGSALVITSFNMRRDDTSTSGAGASTVDVTLDMGDANLGALYSEMDRNFIAGSRRNVFPKKNINWPDWSGSTTTPAPFDLKVPLPAVYIYTGQNALVWDLTMENGTNSNNRFDRDYTGARSANGTNLGTGCTSPGQTSAFLHAAALQSNGPARTQLGMRLRVGALRAPASTPVVLSVGASNANLNVGFCTNVYALPLLSVPLGMSDSTGRVYDCYFNTPYDSSLNGSRLVTQTYSITGGNIYLSNGEDMTMPTNTSTDGHDAAYLWSPLSRTPNNSTIFFGGSIIVQLEQ